MDGVLYKSTNHMNYYMFAFGTNDLKEVERIQRLQNLITFLRSRTPPSRRRSRSESSSSPDPWTESTNSIRSASLSSLRVKSTENFDEIKTYEIEQETEQSEKAEYSQNKNNVKKRKKSKKNFFFCLLRKKSLSIESIAVEPKSEKKLQGQNKPNNVEDSNSNVEDSNNIQSNGSENNKSNYNSSTSSTKANSSLLEVYKQFKHNIEKKLKRLKHNETKDDGTEKQPENNEKVTKTRHKKKVHKTKAVKTHEFKNINNICEYDETYVAILSRLNRINRSYWLKWRAESSSSIGSIEKQENLRLSRSNKKEAVARKIRGKSANRNALKDQSILQRKPLSPEPAPQDFSNQGHILNGIDENKDIFQSTPNLYYSAGEDSSYNICASKTKTIGSKYIFETVSPKIKIGSESNEKHQFKIRLLSNHFPNKKNSKNLNQSYPSLESQTAGNFGERLTLNYKKHCRSLENQYLELSKETKLKINNSQSNKSQKKNIQESQCQQISKPLTNSPLLSPFKTQKIKRQSKQAQETVVQIEKIPSKWISPMGRMGSLEDHERKVIIEFCHLLEKSKQLFNGLRELPQYGHKQWHSYFGRTFDVYTKLWKFQQQFRAILDSKYGLKRWQIGEIASKIGQLYYHFYLRTSETAYLNEAFSFYYAIRGRSYYTKASKEDKCELMVKKLRYYARFIVVCLLLKKIKLVRELIKELDRQIIEYGNTYDPDDQIEWTVVVDEVKAFIQAEPVVSVIHPDSYPIILSHRLSQLTTPPVEKTSQMNLTLQEVLIVGSSTQQVKFSELTMDMFRMLQTLEREPTGDVQHSMFDDSPRQRFNLTPSALNNKGYNLETGASRCENPHKYLLFKPSPSQILVYLASGCNDLPPNGALLLYISADGQIVPPSKHPEDVAYNVGGLITTSKNDLYRDCGKDQKASQSKYKEPQCLHPGDLYPFTRRPLFVIIESDNSYVYQNIPRLFGQPLVVLMSPLELPTSLHTGSTSRGHQGSLFTLFLHSPLTAFCHICDIHTISLVHWERAQSYIDTFMIETSQILTRSRIDPTYLIFMGDDFLRLLTIRFIFCEVVLRLHRSFRTRTQLPRSSPPIPEDLLEHPALIHIAMDLAAHLQVRQNFHDPSAPGPNSKD